VTRATLDSNIYVLGAGIRWDRCAATEHGTFRHYTYRHLESDHQRDHRRLEGQVPWDGYRLHFARLELEKLANVVETTETLNVTGDPDDNRILECAVAACSDVIVSHDNGLLRLREYRGIKIMRADEFVQREMER